MTIRMTADPPALKTALPDEPKLKQTCVQFEGQFFDMMLQEMRKTVPQDTLLGDDANEQDIFTGMMDDQVSQDMAQHGGANDIANAMYRQLIVREHPELAQESFAGSAAVAPAANEENIALGGVFQPSTTVKPLIPTLKRSAK